MALSGGVDSAVLLALALEALGRDRVVAVTGRSPSLAADELEDARRVAVSLGAEHGVLDTAEMDRPGYVANAGDRCYHCRTELFETLDAEARRRGIAAVAYGAIVDDLADERPGMKAARERGVLAPLLEAGIEKVDVRAIAAERGIPVRDKPAAACLSSRIPAGTPVTPERLAQVERAEAALRRLGFRSVRVRHHGELARLELEPPDLERLADADLRQRISAAIRAAGFRYVAADLDGYRPGGRPRPAPALHRIGPVRDGGQ